MRLAPYSLRLSEPLATARGTITERTGWVVCVEHRGTPGAGEAAPLDGWTESPDACATALDRARGAAADADAGREPVLRACRGAPAARHGVALAYADARSRASGLPLYRWLGAGDPVERVPVNATVGDADRGATVDRAREAVEAGYPAVKCKIGARSVAADVDRLSAVRRACPDAVLRADANGAWSRDEARRAVDALADRGLGLEYVEQPLPADDLTGLAGLRDRGVAIAVDETLATHSLDAVLTAGAADAVVLKPMVLGGPERARAAAVRAARSGLSPVVTTTVDAAVARAGAVHAAASLPGIGPCGLATGDRLAEDLGPDPFPVENGHVPLRGKEGNVPLSWLDRYGYA